MLALVAASTSAGAGARDDAALVPLLAIDLEAGHLTIEAAVEGREEAPFIAEFTFERRDGSNRMHSRQSRQIDLSEGGRAVVATAGVSMGATAVAHAVLILRRDGDEIGRLERSVGGDGQ